MARPTNNRRRTPSAGEVYQNMDERTDTRVRVLGVDGALVTVSNIYSERKSSIAIGSFYEHDAIRRSGYRLVQE